MADCPDLAVLRDSKLDEILTQYRESEKLLGLINNYLIQLQEMGDAVCAVPTFFDIDTAVGDQLTIIGKALGWPRVHCAGERKPVFGFACADDCYDGWPVHGFCETGIEDQSWDQCIGPRYKDYTFSDDDEYRRWLRCRILDLTGDFRRANLDAAVQILFDNTGATVIQEIPGVVKVWPGRALTDVEKTLVDLMPEVLPIADGVRLQIVTGTAPMFGFGTGYDGWCGGNFISL